MNLTQIQKIKITATNIKNSLFGYNKQLIKLNKEKVRFSFVREKQKKAKEKEKKIESPFQKTVETIKQKLISRPMSFFDKLKEFFAIVFLGLVVNNLPTILNKIEKFFTENQWLIKAIEFTIKTIGDGIMGMIWFVTEYPGQVQKGMMNELTWAKKEFEKISNILDSAYTVWSSFYNPNSSSPSSSQGSTSSTQSGPSSPVSTGTTSPQQGNALTGGYSGLTGQNYNKGGTVKKPGGSKTPPNQPSKTTTTTGFRGANSTPMGRKAIESVNAFDTFATVTEQVKEHSILLDGKGGINDSFTDVNNSFSQFLIQLKDRKDQKPPKPPGGGGSRSPDPTSSAPSVPGNGKVRGGAIVTDSFDPDGEQTGMDIALLDSRGGYGIGALVQNPFESLKITKIGFQGYGSGDSGQGFGLYVTGEAVVDGKRYELLVAHLNKAHVKQGDVLSGGDSIGEQGISGHATGPHVSTHVNALDGGNAQSILNAVKNSWTGGSLIKSQNMQPGKGGISYMNPKVSSRSPLLSQNMDDSYAAMGAVDFFITQVIEKPVPFPIPFGVNNSSETSTDIMPEINPLILI